jgi:hypothetical protein
MPATSSNALQTLTFEMQHTSKPPYTNHSITNPGL